MNIIVCGLDPGAQLFGFCFIEVSARDFSLIEMGHINLAHDGEFGRLVKIRQVIAEKIRQHQPKRIGVERGFIDWREKREQCMESVLVLAEARGVALEVAAASGAIVDKPAVQTVRKWVCMGGSGGRADKIETQIAVCHQLGLKLCPTGDEADAAAVAIFEGWMIREEPKGVPF